MGTDGTTQVTRSTAHGPRTPRPRRRLARGERRISEILDAAALVIGRCGYELATTNAIAAEAGISPGSLYQFFSNKEDIAQALADRFVTELRAAHEQAFDALDLAELPLDELLDRIVDPIVAFNIAHPGFRALFTRPDMPPGLTDAAAPIQSALLGRVGRVFTARAPDMADLDRDRRARTMIRVFQAMLPLIIKTEGAERAAYIGELKTVLGGYLAATTDERRPPAHGETFDTTPGS